MIPAFIAGAIGGALLGPVGGAIAGAVVGTLMDDDSENGAEEDTVIREVSPREVPAHIRKKLMNGSEM